MLCVVRNDGRQNARQPRKKETTTNEVQTQYKQIKNFPLEAWLLFCLLFVVCCVGSGLSDELISHSEEPYLVCVCVSNCV